MKNKTKDLCDPETITYIQSSSEHLNNLALESLYSKYYEVVKSYIIKNNGTEDDARDIFQDSLIIFYKKIKSGDLLLSCTIKTYIYSICKNKWMDILRGNKNHSRLLENEYRHLNEGIISYDHLEGVERKKIISELLDLIGKDCKKVLYYFYYERLPMKDIAKKMGFSSEQSSKNKKLKCLKRLKQHINNHSEYENSLR